MRTAQIKQLFRIIGGKPAPKGDNAFSDEGTPFIKMKDLGRAHFSNNLVDIEQRVSDEVAKKEGLNLIRRGSILLPRSGSVALNHRAVLGIDAYMVSHICALEVIDQEEVNNLYAYYYLRSIKMDRICKKTTGLDAITFEDLGKLLIPLPRYDDQIRIAHLLGKVEGLIAQRKQHLQQLDDLLKSVFLEMFGDPVQNEKGWEACFLGSIGDVQGGLQVTTKRNDYELNVPYLRVANVYRDRLNLSEIKRIGLTQTELERTRLQTGDLLIVEGHGNPEEVGRSAVWDGSVENCVHQNHLIRVRVDSSRVMPLYASFFINSPGGRQQMFRSGKTTSGLNTISSKNVKETLVTVPPLKLQKQFAIIVEKVESFKSRYQQSLTDLEALYGALSQQAFKGELDLSRVRLN